MATIDPTLYVSGVRQRFALAITDALGGDGWRESRWAYDLFPGPDPRDTLHLGFAVGCPSSTPHPRSRQRPQLIVTTTRVGIRFAFRMRGDSQVDDYDDALVAEGQLMSAVTDAPNVQLWSPRWVGTPIRRVVGDGTVFYGEVQYDVLHNLYVTGQT